MAPDDNAVRSTAAIVVSRSDSAPAPRVPERRWLAAARRVSAALARRSAEPRRWPTVLMWIALGAMVAGLWALLLLGDSLSA